MSDIVVGIDLGTTNSCAAYYYEHDLRILENAEGGRTTPSIVYFNDTEKPVVGNYAKKMSRMKSELAVFGIKRLIGRHINDPDVIKSLKYFPFKLDFFSEEPTIVIEHNETVTKKTPSEISAFILAKIKDDIETKLGLKINKAVITVPAYFNVSQKEATLLAAEKAGFQVLKLLNEPTAVALNYYHYNQKNNTSSHHSLVYDLGGGTFDVAVLKKSDNNIEIVCIDDDTHLGGHDFDEKIFDYVCEKMKRLHNFGIQNDRRKTRRLLGLCEEAKKTLSASSILETSIDLLAFGVVSDDIIEIILTKKQFEEMIQPYIQKTIQIVDNCLKTSKFTKDDIAEVIIAGGSSRIPKIRETLSEYFNRKELNTFVNPTKAWPKELPYKQLSYLLVPVKTLSPSKY